MRRLAIALGTLACVLGGSIGYAKAPIIIGVPDVFIGDREDNVLTVDNNWFRHANAFNILNYTSDVDSPNADLLFTFFEQTTANDIGIRIDQPGATAATKTQVNAADRTRPVNWGPNEITNFGATPRDYLVSFVDLIRSPQPYGSVPYPNPTNAGGTPIVDPTAAQLPWHNVQGSGALTPGSDVTGRTVWFYAADDELADGADRVSFDSIQVISRNYGFDALQGNTTSVFSTGFATGAGTTGDAYRWLTGPLAGLGVCTSGAGAASGNVNGYISLTAPVSASSIFFNRWYQEVNGTNGDLKGAIPYSGPGLVYCARFIMSQNAATRGAAPGIRLGAVESLELSYVMQVIKPVPLTDLPGNPNIPGQNLLHTYKVAWSANEASPDFASLDQTGTVGVDARAYNAVFDMLDINDAAGNGQGGTWTLNDLQVVTSPRPADATPRVSYTDFRPAPWTIDPAMNGGGTITAVTSTGAIVTTDNGRAWNAAAFPLLSFGRVLNAAEVRWDDNQVLRFKVGLLCPSTTDRQRFHWFRLRQNTTGFNVSQEWSISGDDGVLAGALGGGRPYIPDTDGHVYEVYMPSQVYDPAFDWSALEGVGYHQIIQSFDVFSLMPRVSADNVNTTHDKQTHVTVQSLVIEALADSL